MALEEPSSGFTKKERAWIKKLVAEIRSAKAVAGENVTISGGDNGEPQTIKAADCDCTLCP